MTLASKEEIAEANPPKENTAESMEEKIVPEEKILEKNDTVTNS